MQPAGETMRSISELPVRVFSARIPSRSIASSLTRVVQEVWTTRGVIWRLFARDFTVHIRQKLLGLLWAFLGPIIGAASFVFLNYAGVLNPGNLTMPYPLFLFVGMTLWGLFTSVITVISGGLLTHSDLVLRTNIPKVTLVLSGTANVLYLQLINLVILLILFIFYGVVPSWWILMFPLMVIPLMALALGIGLVLAVIAVMARDVTAMVTTVLNLVMFVTPVLYASPVGHALLQRVIYANPLTYLIYGPRRLVFLGTTESAPAFALASIFCFFVLALGIHAFYLVQDKVAERL